MFGKLKVQKLKKEIETLESLLIKHNVYEKEERLQKIIENKLKTN
jgi:hypothetical protein